LTRQRLIQLGLIAAAVAAVVVADRTAESLLVVDQRLAARRLHAFLVVGGRVLAGWTLGMAFRMQFTRAASSDDRLRLLVGVPAGFLAAWPIVLTFLPGWLSRALPGWLAGGWAVEAAPFAGVVLGLTLALAVRAKRG
jgi:hypothetical protein